MKKTVSFMMLTLLLMSTLTLALPLDLVHATNTRKVAIDVTKIDYYTPGFNTAMSALEAEGYRVDVWRDGEITANRLADYYVLIIHDPIEAYSQSEVSAILDFVSSGHGLLISGERGQVALNPITGPLGISINNDVLCDPTDYYSWHSFWPLIHIFEPHPVTEGISIYNPAATTTLEVNSPAITIATGDYDTYTEPASETGYQPVLAASVYGMGRAVVAGDSVWIMDYDYTLDPEYWCGIGMYDNKKLLVNAVKWLSEAESIPTPPIWTQWWLWAIVGGTVIVTSIVLILKIRKKPKPIIIAPPERKPVG